MRLAEAEELHGRMVRSAETVDQNFQRNFKGLVNFSPSNRRRRLAGGESVTGVQSLKLPTVQAVIEGVYEPVSANAKYVGSQLKPDDTSVNEIDQQFSRKFDFSKFKSPSESDDDDVDDEYVLTELRLGAADLYFGELYFDDDDFIGRQPIIQLPRLSIPSNSPGSSQSNPIVLSCAGSISVAWDLKLDSSDPLAILAKRTKSGNIPIVQTIADFAVMAEMERKLLAGDGINVAVEPGVIEGEGGDEDIFKEARALLGVNGVGNFMDTTSNTRSRQLNGATLSDYILDIELVDVQPQRDRFEWTFEIYITDNTGRESNPITIYATLNYGDAGLQSATVFEIQTVCDTDGTDVEALDDDQVLQFYYGVTRFSPELERGVCRSPFLTL